MLLTTHCPLLTPAPSHFVTLVKETAVILKFAMQNSSLPQTVAHPTADDVKSKAASTEPKPSYVKLAMRNMVRKGGKSLQHFAITTIGLLAVLVGLAYLTR